MKNVDHVTVSGFGLEWKSFDQACADDVESVTLFNQYFAQFPWRDLAKDAVGADFGCGSGRWAKLVAPKVGHLHLVDASAEALLVAKNNLRQFSNLTFHHASIEEPPIEAGSLDFAFSLGVLHHLPDTERALSDIARQLKKGAPFLVYLYYALDARPWWYRALWRMTDLVRWSISRLPFRLKWLATQLIALGIYWPLARTARLLDSMGIMPASWPLGYYRDRSLYVMRTDALDRFGTRLEKRFRKDQIFQMLRSAGFEKITFSEGAPYWCALAYKEVAFVG